MKKQLLGLLVIAAMTFVCVGLTGCSKDADEDQVNSVFIKHIVGTWKNGVSVLVINADHTGSYTGISNDEYLGSFTYGDPYNVEENAGEVTFCINFTFMRGLSQKITIDRKFRYKNSERDVIYFQGLPYDRVL